MVKIFLGLEQLTVLKINYDFQCHMHSDGYQLYLQTFTAQFLNMLVDSTEKKRNRN